MAGWFLTLYTYTLSLLNNDVLFVPLAVAQSLTLNETSRSPSCFALLGRFIARSDAGLQSYATSREEQGFTMSNASTSSKTSTLVDEENQTSICTCRSWLPRVVGAFLRTHTDSVASSPADDALQTSPA